MTVPAKSEIVLTHRTNLGELARYLETASLDETMALQIKLWAWLRVKAGISNSPPLIVKVMK